MKKLIQEQDKLRKFDIRKVTNICRYGVAPSPSPSSSSSAPQHVFVINVDNSALYVQCFNESDMLRWIETIKSTMSVGID